jgi:Fe-S-cluster containining protein
MFPAALERERQELFAQASRGMARRLGSAATPDALFGTLRWGLDELDRTYAATPAAVRARVACRAGCGHCCSVPVDTQAHEVLFAAQHIQLHFSADALAGVIDRTATHRRRVAGWDDAARTGSLTPCPLLDAQGSCTIYEGRPAICRAHHASDAAACAASTHPGDFERVHLPALKARMFATMLGVDDAIESAGFDERAYDFGSALHEALTDSFCLARWVRREPAFPDSCLAER